MSQNPQVGLPESTAAHQFNINQEVKLLMTPVYAGGLLDYKPQTTRNLLNLNKFPLPLVLVNGRKMVRGCDFVKFLASLAPIQEKKEIKRGPGRPRKIVGGAK